MMMGPLRKSFIFTIGFYAIQSYASKHRRTHAHTLVHIYILSY